MRRFHGNWTTLFTATILSRGKAYFNNGKVKKPVRNEDGYSLTVRGSRNYTVKTGLDIHEKLTYVSCTCPYAASGMYCKHMSAGLFYMEEYLGRAINLAENEKNDRIKGDIDSFEKDSSAKKESDSIGNLPVEEDRETTAEKTDLTETERHTEELFPDLMGLQKSEIAARESEGTSTSFVPTDYRYFDSDNLLSDIKFTATSRRNAEELLKHKQDLDLKVDFRYREGTSSEELVGEATLSDAGSSYFTNWTVRLTFGRDRILSSTCSGWNCHHARYYGSDQYACEHQIAAITLLQDYLKKKNPGDSTNLSGIFFLRGISGEKENAEVRPTLTIVPYITRDGEELYVNFRVGSEKMYKIKSLPEFVHFLNNGEQMTFGTKTTLTLGREHVRPESVKWLDFIENFLQDEKDQFEHFKSMARYQFYTNDIGCTKDRINLTGRTLDSFFDTALGDTLEFNDKAPAGKSKKMLLFQEGDISVKLKISAGYGPRGTLDGIIITGDVPEMIGGMKRKYYISDRTLSCISEERTTALKAVLDAEHGGYIRIMIGRSHLAEFYHKVFPVLQNIVEIESTPEVEAAVATILPPEPEYVTYFDVDSGNIIGRCDVYYDNERRSLTDVWEKDVFETYRNFEDEENMRRLLMRYFTSYDSNYHILFVKKDSDITFDLLDRGIPAIMQKSEVRMTDRFRALKIRNRSKFDIGLSVESSLLDLTVSSSDLSPDELLDILFGYRKKKRYITLKNGDFFKLDENESVARLSAMMESLHISPKDFVAGKMHIPAYRALYLDKMLESTQDIYATRDSRFKSLIKEFKTVEDADYEIPASLKKTLRKYQTVGYRWLRTLDAHSFGGILADDMGLGKTLQVIAVLLAVRNEFPEEKFTSLIVTPASLVYNWKEEIRIFAENLNVTLITGTQNERRTLIDAWQDSDVLVTSYDLLKRDVTEYEGKKFRFLVADEAQYIKNRSTAAAKSLKLVQADTRFALTGTPIENRLGELWSIFDYLMPGLLYSYDEFRNSFELPIVKSENEAALEQLRKMVTPFILRRKKNEVLKDLPDKLEEVRFARMESKQQKLYDAQVVRMRRKLQDADESDFRKGKIEILAELMHIRQICCDPSLMFENYDGQSAKRELCMDLVDSLIDGDHRALIFSQFTTMLEKLEEDLKNKGIEYYKITGSTPKEKRVALVKAFNEGSVPLFLISLKAGGTGLNLTGADVVIHYDPWWNLAVQDQATDRAHRIGQTKVVNVYKLIVKGTIEEKIVEMQNAKRKLADDILQADGVASAAISREELLELLT